MLIVYRRVVSAEELRKEIGHVLLTDPNACIFNADTDRAIILGLSRDRNLALPRCELIGVTEKIAEYLHETHAVGPYVRYCGWKFEVDALSFGFKLRAHAFGSLKDRFREIDVPELDPKLPCLDA